MPKNTMKIKWYEQNKRQNILQIYKRGLEFAFVSRNYEQCHPFVLCKDFLQLVIFSNIHNKPISLFNFNYNPNKFPIDFSSLKLILRNTSDPEFTNKINNSIVFINIFENLLKIKKTRYRLCENNTIFITGSKRWLKAPPLISMYMLLLRIGIMHSIEKPIEYTINGILKNSIKPYQSKDASLLRSSLYGIDKIIKNGDRKLFCQDIKKNYPDINLMTIHRDGILFYSTELCKANNQTPQMYTSWQSL